MNVRYRLTPAARKGCRRIHRYVDERFGSDVAERVARGLERAFEQISTYPDIGHPRDDLTTDRGVRFWLVGPTLIAYRPWPQGVEIIFVERGTIDWESRLLEERPQGPESSIGG